MSRELDRLSPLGRYSVASNRIAKSVIGAYSTSFGLSTRMLGPRHRNHVRNIYALVRVADELVDGVADEAGIALAQQHEMLDLFEAETESGMSLGYSSNPIVHAFYCTAREAGIGVELTRPFFSSMRTDLRSAASAPDIGPGSAAAVWFSGSDHAEYVYGSAEVVGLMCLRVFDRGRAHSAQGRRRLEHGARCLGAAFQNVNFLRDLGDDTQRLGRSYLSESGAVDSQSRDRWIALIREQIDEAARTIPLLPRDARLAVHCALRLFSTLADRLAQVPVEELTQRRVTVAGPQKAALLLRTALDVRTRSPR